eukprot:gene828-9078_t
MFEDNVCCQNKKVFPIILFYMVLYVVFSSVILQIRERKSQTYVNQYLETPNETHVVPTLKKITYLPPIELKKCRDPSIPRNFDIDPIIITIPPFVEKYEFLNELKMKDGSKHLKSCDINCFYSTNFNNKTKISTDGFLTHFTNEKQKKTCQHQKNIIFSSTEWHEFDKFDIEVSKFSQKSNIYLSNFNHDLTEPYIEKTRESIALSYISNCNFNVNTDRLKILKELRSHGVSIDEFGRCSKTDDEPIELSDLNRKNRRIENMRRYKFYLAFENTFEKGFISERYWEALNSGTIPVYLGPSDIKNYEPSVGSILYLNDFNSTKDLANEMLRISSDNDLYEKMLDWKSNGPSDNFLAAVDYTCENVFCKICYSVADKYVPEIKIDEKETFTLFVRELNTFRHIPIQIEQKTLSDLKTKILESFKTHIPRWWNCKTKFLRKNIGNGPILKIHKIVKSGLKYDELLFGNSIDSNEKVDALKSGTKLDVIFV